MFEIQVLAWDRHNIVVRLKYIWFKKLQKKECYNYLIVI